MTDEGEAKVTRFRGSTSPHIKSESSVQGVMLMVILALLFPTAGAVWYFGLYAVALVGVCVITALLVEYLSKRLRKRDFYMDGSAIITGMLVALILPPRIPLWVAAIGAAIAIAIAKEAFGGLGHNIFNPALVGRAFLVVSFAAFMTDWRLPVESLTADAIAGATPLGENFIAPARTMDLYTDLFFGNVGGSLGETSAFLILMGGSVLLATRVINWRIPLFYIGTVFLLSGAFWLYDPDAYFDPIVHVLAGGLMLGAFFMATDYVTCPLTNKGKMIFAVGAGALVVAIRIFGGMPEGVAFSILIMNAFTPLIDRYTKPKPFGYVAPEKKDEGKDKKRDEKGETKEGKGKSTEKPEVPKGERPGPEKKGGAA